MAILIASSAARVHVAAIAAAFGLCGCTSSNTDDARFAGGDAAADAGDDARAACEADAACTADAAADAACEPVARLITDFESGVLPDGWQTTAEQPWTVGHTPPTLGHFSASSSAGQDMPSELEFALTETAAGAQLRFDVRVSGEGYFWLIINDVEIRSWDGEQPWQRYLSAPLPPGSHRVRFRYRNSYWKEGEERAYIDNVSLVEPCPEATDE